MAHKAASDTLAAQDKLSEATVRKLALTIRNTPGAANGAQSATFGMAVS